MTRYLILGGSRGLGARLGAGLPESGDSLWIVSRSEPPILQLADGVTRHWIQADLSDPAAIPAMLQGLGPLDVVIYNAGIWEWNAFSPSYDLAKVSPAEVQQIMMVNLTAAILCLQALLPNLKQGQNPKIILIGSINGLENMGGRESAYNASKMGLRGFAHALREQLREDRIAVTCLNLGSLAGDSDPEADKAHIPTRDMIALLRCLVGLSGGTCVKEIDMPAMLDPL